MANLLRGALIEYGSDFLGPLPNVVIFQFNPVSMTRTIEIPRRPSGAAAREASQAGEPPTEKLSIKAEFSAADHLGENHPLARSFGIGPQLAALEKMVHPSNVFGGAIGAAVDAIGDALGGGGDEPPPEQPIPREKYPRILFLWGITRVLPVIIDSMSITEQQYDPLLNPIRAEVNIGFSVAPINRCSDDLVGRGALKYTETAKEAMAMANLANTAELAVDMIPF